MDLYYFGCRHGESGHNLWHRDTRVPPSRWPAWPWPQIDGKLTPIQTAQNTWALHWLEGWSALAMHDYTIDTRPGSNAVFLGPTPLAGRHDILAEAAEVYPDVVARLGLTPDPGEA